MTTPLETLEAALLSKRQNLLTDYGLTDKPTMVWQAAPVEATTVHRQQLANTDFFDGDDRPSRSNGWWQSFKTYRGGLPVFDGWSSMDYADGGSAWVVEVHHDGHLLVAYWDFDNRFRKDTADSLVVPAFFDEAFFDFGALAKSLYPRIQYPGLVAMTCSLTGAQKVSFGNHYGAIARVPSRRSELAWPVRTAASPEDIDATVEAMRLQLVRASGRQG